MMDIEALVTYITDKIMLQLANGSESNHSKKLYILGETTNQIEEFISMNEYVISTDKQTADAILVADLSVSLLSQVALFSPQSNEASCLLSFFKEKKPVFIVKDSLSYANEVEKLPYLMGKVIKDYESTLESFGGVFVECYKQENNEKRQVLTYDKLGKLGLEIGSEFEVSEGTIVTSLAKDYLREKQITLIYRRKEE